jgi:asparagine synthase (glutamine-hydrolysing)
VKGKAMSIQSGIWNFDGEPADEQFLARVGQATARNGPDGLSFYTNGAVSMLYRPFHTTNQSYLEIQPYVSPNNVLTWDGRLDNREELVGQLDEYLTRDHTDVAIVAAAFDKWGTNCFSKLLGDWALVVWCPRDQTLILAKDFMGIRHLYYQRTPKRVFWCTTLEPIVLMADSPWQINGEFVAGYLASCPPADVTPYVGVDAVPPCSYVAIRRGQRKIERYWWVDPSKKIRYSSDAEYEEHFRQVLRGAVRSRLRSHDPIMAELSGGVDSSSIVCLADLLIAEGVAETPRLDTMSYYDDDEPNWNERPFFQKVEEKRGRSGGHISVAPRDSLVPLAPEFFVAVPGVDQNSLWFESEQATHMLAQGNRVLLSGIGGDEVLGGVPTPIPELADLLSQLRLAELASKLNAWSLARKQSWSQLAAMSFRRLSAKWMHGHDSSRLLWEVPWLDQDFMKLHRESLRLNHGTHLRGCLPSQRVFLDVLAHLADQLALSTPPLVAPREMRYPYLDRLLCEFLFAIPREQLLRPAQRRSLMRRALIDVVPSEIIHRKRKAFTVRRVLAGYGEAWPALQARFDNSLSQSLHYVDESKFLQTLDDAIHGQLSNLTRLNRTIALELWLRMLLVRNELIIQHLAVPQNKFEIGQLADPNGSHSMIMARDEFRRS